MAKGKKYKDGNKGKKHKKHKDKALKFIPVRASAKAAGICDPLHGSQRNGIPPAPSRDDEREWLIGTQ